MTDIVEDALDGFVQEVLATTVEPCNVTRPLSEQSWLPIQDNPPPKDGTFVLLGVIAEGYKTAIVEGWFDEGEWRDAAGNVVDPIGWLPRDVLPPLPPKDR